MEEVLGCSRIDKFVTKFSSLIIASLLLLCFVAVMFILFLGSCSSKKGGSLLKIID